MKDKVYGMTHRAKDGRELRTLAWIPNEAVRKDFYNKAQKNGLEVIVNEEPTPIDDKNLNE